MSSALDRWDDWYNAAVYDSFVESSPIYPALNRLLASLASLETCERVLDLACGTGATAESCLRRMPRDAELVGVDHARAMVETAEARILDPRARFVVADAGDVATAVDGPFDRVVSNAAFWQLPDMRRVMTALASLTEPGAWLVFNVPANQLEAEETRVHSFQVALARSLREAGGDDSTVKAPILNDERLGWLLGSGGFEVERREPFTYVGRQQELVELMEIPAMNAALAPGLDPDARAEAVRAAGERTDPNARVEVRWIYFVARRV